MLHEFQIGSLPNATFHKQLLIFLVTKFFDTSAENNPDIITTSFTFYEEIDTADIRPLIQPVRRLFYYEILAAVELKVDKLVSATIARQLILLWASPVVMVRKINGGW